MKRMMTMRNVLGALCVGAMLLAGGMAPAYAATVKITVNEIPITDVQISQRVKLLTLERRASTKAAQDELINEALQLSEAKRLGITVSDAQVEDAMLNVARNIKVSRDKLGQILSQSGVNIATLQDRLRAAIAWGKVTEQAVQPKVQISDLELDQEAAKKLKSDSSFDYILKEIIFVMPGGKGSASARTGQANQYRKSFHGCDSAVEVSMKFNDAAVIDVGRRHATQMPDAVAAELAKLNVGGITKPRVVANGVSMLAVCSKAVAEDLTFIKNNIRQETGNEKLKSEAEAYLKGLKDKARITYS